MSEVLKILAHEVRTRRRKRGLSQEKFAEATEISMALVSEIERGVANPTLSTLEKIANFFEISLSELFSKQKNPNQIHQTRYEIVRSALNLSETKVLRLEKYLASLMRKSD